MGRGGTMGGGKPPLCRAVHLALGVAVLGSLMGGVQLFGMIKMLGLQKADMSSQQNEWAWYGYQVRSKNLPLNDSSNDIRFLSKRISHS